MKRRQMVRALVFVINPEMGYLRKKDTLRRHHFVLIPCELASFTKFVDRLLTSLGYD